MIINTLDEFKAWILADCCPKNLQVSPEVIRLVRPRISYNDEAMNKIRRAGTIEAFLQHIINKGYLLHGSSEPPIYSVLIPFDPSHILINIVSFCPWGEGTRQLLKTIHIEKVA